MPFGERTGENVRSDIKNSSGQGNFLKTVQDGKDLRVRFLQEPENWYKYREHYSQSTKFFPCTQDETCPGCNSESEQLQRSSRRYVASVLDVEQGKVVPLKMPVDLANRVTNKCDRNNGTLLDRDFTLIRTGKGMNDTTYDVEVEDKTQVDISRYEVIDPEPMLEASFKETFGDDPQPVVDTSPQATIAELQAQLQKVSESPKVPEAPVNVVESGPVRVTPPKPDEAQAEPDFISKDQLEAMDGPDLREMCRMNGITPPEGCIDKSSLLEWLLQEFGINA